MQCRVSRLRAARDDAVEPSHDGCLEEDARGAYRDSRLVLDNVQSLLPDQR